MPQDQVTAQIGAQNSAYKYTAHKTNPNTRLALATDWNLLSEKYNKAKQNKVVYVRVIILILLHFIYLFCMHVCMCLYMAHLWRPEDDL